MTIERWETPHSSNIAAVEHDSDTQQMTVHFKSGASYALSGITLDHARALGESSSPGADYNRNYRKTHAARKL